MQPRFENVHVASQLQHHDLFRSGLLIQCGKRNKGKRPPASLPLSSLRDACRDASDLSLLSINACSIALNLLSHLCATLYDARVNFQRVDKLSNRNFRASRDKLHGLVDAPGLRMIL